MNVMESVRPFGLLGNENPEASESDYDPICPVPSKFPLGRRFGASPVDESEPGAAATRPFGLRYSRLPKRVNVIDITEFVYDKERQVTAGKPLGPDHPFIPDTYANPGKGGTANGTGYGGTHNPSTFVGEDTDYSQDYESD
ncbi:hypothetical protein OG462_42220 [Streptomyces sp. NBC_01077]|uniref:hypothetical protein n=1 Tax=Streptomyces sp. NBC_01077 TaxID=2903746 RepID=UPI00386DB2F9|nr:hypothetical protein OG462_02800 [Streptomyces sp. NBC_01077]WSV43478.1 hypothetical protein OG462_42220 [Streptomyces sp. NBC_01077]